MSNDTLLGVSEAADRIGVSSRTIKRWALNGTLRYRTKLPGDTGAYIFDLAEVERLAAERGVAA